MLADEVGVAEGIKKQAGESRLAERCCKVRERMAEVPGEIRNSNEVTASGWKWQRTKL